MMVTRQYDESYIEDHERQYEEVQDKDITIVTSEPSHSTPTVMTTLIQQPMVQQEQNTAMYYAESQERETGMMVAGMYDGGYMEETHIGFH